MGSWSVIAAGLVIFSKRGGKQFDQIEAVGVVNRDVPVEGLLKQCIRDANAVGNAVARFEPIHERTFDLGDLYG